MRLEKLPLVDRRGEGVVVFVRGSLGGSWARRRFGVFAMDGLGSEDTASVTGMDVESAGGSRELSSCSLTLKVACSLVWRTASGTHIALDGVLEVACPALSMLAFGGGALNAAGEVEEATSSQDPSMNVVIASFAEDAGERSASRTHMFAHQYENRLRTPDWRSTATHPAPVGREAGLQQSGRRQFSLHCTFTSAQPFTATNVGNSRVVVQYNRHLDGIFVKRSEQRTASEQNRKRLLFSFDERNGTTKAHNRR